MEHPAPIHGGEASIDQAEDTDGRQGQDSVQGLHQQGVQGLSGADQGGPVVPGDTAGGDSRDDGDEDDMQDVTCGKGGEDITGNETIH